MHDLQKIARVCLDEVTAAGMTPGHILSFSANNRLTACHGKAKGTRRRDGRGYDFTIEIAGFMLDDACPLAELKNTVIHEILHTCEGGQNHGPTWQLYARTMNRKYGYNIATYADEKEIAATAQARMKVNPPKYTTICNKCGFVEYTYRMCGFVRNPGRYLCPVCHSSDWKRL